MTDVELAQTRQAAIESQLRHAQKMETLGSLATGLAHDLNNMLVPVTMLAPMLLENAHEASERQSLEMIIASAGRAKALVREMLVFSRTEPSGFERLRLDTLVEQSLTVLRAGIPASISIIDDLAPAPAITGSKGQTYQILLILAVNAAQAIGDRTGTITIRVGYDAPGAQGGASVGLSFTDDGDGMDGATMRRIFEPFFSTKAGEEGAGRGLSMVGSIVKTHGGTITARSALGQGTRFDPLFPALVPECVA